MALTPISPTIEAGQRSIEAPFLFRRLPTWMAPTWLTGERWRQVVHGQMIAMICRNTIITTLQSSPWRVVPRDAVNVSKYDKEIDYYSTLIETEDGGYENHVDLLFQDALDLPAGGMTEIGREGDSPSGKVMWYSHVDGATIFPTYNKEWPVGQLALSYGATQPVYFPVHTVRRIGYSPRPELIRKGWYMAPPEKIYLALELLTRGDRYYANLLLDTPEAGILDLGDTSKDTAEEWLRSWRDLIFGSDAFKVPVIYEHASKVEFIKFARSPAEMSYDATTLRYMKIVAAGYDLSLSDIGISEGGAAGGLAGAIRQERRSFRTGIGAAERKLIAYYNGMLPSYLRFEMVVKDEEALLARGRARLANSMGLTNLVTGGIINAETAQDQLIADGLLTVAVSKVTAPPAVAGSPLLPKHPVDKALRTSVPVSSGGTGEVTAKSLVALTPSRCVRMVSLLKKSFNAYTDAAKERLTDSEFGVWRSEFAKVCRLEPSEFDDIESVKQSWTDAKKSIENELSDIVVLLSAADAVSSYEKAALEVASEIAISAYENGLAKLGVPAFKLTNTDVIKELGSHIASFNSVTTSALHNLILDAAGVGLFEGLTGDEVYSYIVSRAEAIINGQSSAFNDWMLESVVGKMIPEQGTIPSQIWSGG